METGALLLRAMAAAIRGETVSWQGMCSPSQWMQLLELAQQHHVHALVVDAAYRCPDFAALQPDLQQRMKRKAVQDTAVQSVRTLRFLNLYASMEQAGLRPLIMKGLVCRSLYPKPAARPSSDEDLLVPAAQFHAAADFLKARGMVLQTLEEPDAFELGFLSKDGLYLELHRLPFSPASEAVRDCNEPFAAVHERAVSILAEDSRVWTMCPQDHMQYLLLHAFKHFIHCGFGIRQVCDMVLWAERYGEEISWEDLRTQCRSLGCGLFLEAVFQTGAQYLGFDAEKACYPAAWLRVGLPLEAFVQDMLDGGIYGSADRSRLHSSTMTVGAVEAERTGKKRSVLSSVFPAREKLAGSYPYLRKYPVLLPAAWCSRLMRYGKEVLTRGNGSSAAQSLQIGAQRTALLRRMEIIES